MLAGPRAEAPGIFTAARDAGAMLVLASVGPGHGGLDARGPRMGKLGCLVLWGQRACVVTPEDITTAAPTPDSLL